MQLSDNSIKLSPLGDSDEGLFIDILTCPTIMKHISKPLTIDEAKAAFEVRSQPWHKKSSGWCTLPINELNSEQKVGWISFRIISHDAQIAEVGFILKSDVHRRGLTSRAFKLLKEYAFNELKLNKLVAYCSVNNGASYGALEKLGFVREGCFKQHIVINDKLVDSYAYGMCKSA